MPDRSRAFVSLVSFLSLAAARAGEEGDLSKMVAPAKPAPWEVVDVTFETGAIWRITDSTAIDYVVLPQMLSFRIPIDWTRDLESGGTFAIRTRLSLLGEYFLEGPETYFFGFHGSPSMEWWNAERDFAILYSVGGGVGFLDSTAVEGGHGQDFNFNWFMQLALRHE